MITTDRLILRPPVLADLEPGFALATAPETTRFIGAGVLPDPETHWMKSLRDIGHWAHFGYGIFTVTDRADTRLLGKVGLSHFARGLGPDFDPFPEASWIMAAETHGKGLAHEAVRPRMTGSARAIRAAPSASSTRKIRRHASWPPGWAMPNTAPHPIADRPRSNCNRIPFPLDRNIPGVRGLAPALPVAKAPAS